MKTFVVAGSHHQAMEWIKKDISNAAKQHGQWRSIGDYVYVSCAADLRGYSDPHGVFIGTWKDRVDIREIVECLMIQSTLPHPILREIWDEVSHKVKPTPKKRNPLLVYVNGIVQQENTDYAVTDEFVAFQKAPQKGTQVILKNLVNQRIYAADGRCDTFRWKDPTSNAAQLLADAIDAEVLRKLVSNYNGMETI